MKRGVWMACNGAIMAKHGKKGEAARWHMYACSVAHPAKKRSLPRTRNCSDLVAYAEHIQISSVHLFPVVFAAYI